MQIYSMLQHSLVTHGVDAYTGIKRKLFSRDKWMVNVRNSRSHTLGRQYFVLIDSENTWMMILELNYLFIIQC